MTAQLNTANMLPTLSQFPPPVISGTTIDLCTDHLISFIPQYQGFCKQTKKGVRKELRSALVENLKELNYLVIDFSSLIENLFRSKDDSWTLRDLVRCLYDIPGMRRIDKNFQEIFNAAIPGMNLIIEEESRKDQKEVLEDS